jgi:hypothetical protein
MNTTANTAANIRAQILAETNARIAELEAILADELTVVSDCGWVVVSAIGMPLKFDIQGRDVKGVTTATVTTCSQLSRANAVHLAAAVKDGNGTPGKAMPRVQALRNQIEESRELVRTITGL